MIGPGTHPSWQRAVDSIYDVVDALGGIIRDRETGKTLDPGQAVCREMFGPNWQDIAAYKEFSDAEVCGEEWFAAVRRLVAKEPAWLDVDNAERC